MQKTFLFGCVALLGTLAACTGAPPVTPAQLRTLEQIQTQGNATVQSFVGKLENSQIYIALTMRGHQVEVYLCDGAQEVKTSFWFDGTLENGKIQATPRGHEGQSAKYHEDSISAELQGNTVLGEWKQGKDGATVRFALERATGDAGLWNVLSDPVDNKAFRVAWIVLPDGTQRGATRTRPAKVAGVLNTITGKNDFAEKFAEKIVQPVLTNDNSNLPVTCQNFLEGLKNDLTTALANPSSLTQGELAGMNAQIDNWNNGIAMDPPTEVGDTGTFYEGSCAEITGAYFPNV
jgi:hypothetical protein